MPLHALSELVEDGKVMRLVDQLPAFGTGLVLSGGPPGSGKLTILMGIAHRLRDDGPVELLVDRLDDLSVFEPLPAGWSARQVAASAQAWAAAIAAVPRGALLVVSPLGPSNAAATVAASADRLVLALLDSPLVGIDAAYALRALGVPYEQSAATLRCVWSQLLLERLCPQCSEPATLPAAEATALFGAKPAPSGLRRAATTGCPACEGRGTQGWVAVCDVAVVADADRAAFRAAVLADAASAASSGSHVTMREHAQRLLSSGVISVDSFRDVVARNPALRASS